MQASQETLAVAGGSWNASLNHYNTGGNCFVTTEQIDEFVFVVGQDDFAVARYTLDEWLSQSEQDPEPQVIECENAVMAWDLLRALRADCYLWQCGACDGWLFTTNRPSIGVLRCSTCGDGGVDFEHADKA